MELPIIIIIKKPELNPTFSSLKANFATPDKKTTAFYGNFYKDTFIIILDMPTNIKWAFWDKLPLFRGAPTPST